MTYCARTMSCGSALSGCAGRSAAGPPLVRARHENSSDRRIALWRGQWLTRRSGPGQECAGPEQRRSLARWRLLRRFSISRSGTCCHSSARDRSRRVRRPACGSTQAAGTELRPHQRRTGPISSTAPIRSVRKPGSTSSKPASTVRKPAGIGLDPGDVGVGDRDAKRAIRPRPAWRSTSDAGERGRQHQGERPRPARSGRPPARNIGDFGDRKQQDGDDNPFHHMPDFRPRARLARGRGSSMVGPRQLCRPCRPARLWMAAVACLHYSVGTGTGVPR